MLDVIMTRENINKLPKFGSRDSSNEEMKENYQWD